MLLRERPERAIALATEKHVLLFRHTTSGSVAGATNASTAQSGSGSASSTGPRCIVELASAASVDLSEYRTISYSVHGTLGLITVENDVFLCVVSGTTQAATVKPGETIQKILSVDFRMLPCSKTMLSVELIEISVKTVLIAHSTTGY